MPARPTVARQQLPSPRASTFPAFQPQTSPRPPQRKPRSRSPTRQGLHVAWGCQLCLVFLPAREPQTPSRHGGARILGKAQRPYTAGWAAHRAHVLSCALSPHSTWGWHGALPMWLPQSRAPACQCASLPPNRPPLWPQSCAGWLLAPVLLHAPSKPHHWVGLGGRPGLPRGTLCRRDMHVPHVPCTP